MTLTVDNKPIVIPDAVRRKAGLRRGDRVEFKVSGRAITIVPKLTPDEVQDEREIHDPKIRKTLREGYQEFAAGKSRPIEQLFAERTAARRPKRTRTKA
jgi:AbrB family looped-hinge helix DNA binding protein